MRQKTYLTTEQQWDRTVALAKKCGFGPEGFYDRGLNDSWYLGQIVQPHSLFRVGDFVIIDINNGQAERHPVWGYSSKGRAVIRKYLNYQCFADHPGVIRRTFRATSRIGWVRRKVKKKCHRPLRSGRFPQGPLRFVEVPEHLAGLQPDAPPLRQHIVALAREGWRTPDKRE